MKTTLLPHTLRRILLALLAFATLGTAPTLVAQVPQIINYQGRISVGTAPFSGTGQFRFALVNGDGTQTFWSNDGTSTVGSAPTAAVALPVVNGLYVVPLGDTAVGGMLAVPASVFTNGDVRLRVWFDDGTANGSQLLTPDQRITAVGYAMVAGTVPDGAITAAKIAPGQTLAANISGNATTATTAANATTLQNQLGTAGAINTPGNPVDWSQLKGVPAAFASGTIDDTTKVAKSGDTMSGNLSMNGNKVTNLASPTASGDAATLGYVGPIVSGLQTQVNNLQAVKLDIFGNGSGLTDLQGAALQAGTVPLSALASAAAPKFDRQLKVSPGAGAITVTQNGAIDVPGVTLTTKNLGGAGTYTIHFQVSEFRNTGSTTPSYYILNIDGADVGASRAYSLGSTNVWSPATLHFLATGLTAGKVIKVRMSPGFTGTYQFADALMVIDGVPSSQVVP